MYHCFPVGAGDSFCSWEFCLLNSNLCLQHFPIKLKPEDHGVGRELSSVEDHCRVSTERASPASRMGHFPSGNSLLMVGSMWGSLLKTEVFLTGLRKGEKSVLYCYSYQK